MATIKIKAGKADVKRLLAEFVEAFAGRTTKHREIVQGIQLRLAMVLLSQIQQDFITKARGGTGVDGIKWPKLSKKYLAYGRRFGRGEKSSLLRAAGARNRGGRRPLLTAAQDAQWRRDFAQTKAWLEARGLDEAEASRRAAAIAWNKAKAAGGKTKLEVFGNREAEILRDTGLLLRSFSPGTTAEGQIRRTPPGEVVVGTNRMVWHHTGTRRGLPARPFWPVDGDLPPEYWKPILQAAKNGVLEAITRILAGE